MLVVLSGRSLAAIPERERALRGKLELRVFALCKVDGEEHLVLTLGPLDLRAVYVCVSLHVYASSYVCIDIQCAGINGNTPNGPCSIQ